ncbi:MAG: M16 family metallopeptidase [Planctomycetota bacterium]
MNYTLTEARCPCGIQVGGVHLPERKLVKVILQFAGGLGHDDPAQRGVQRMAAELMNKGTAKRSMQDFADALDATGSSVQVHIDHEATEVEISCLSEFLTPTLELAAEMLLTPAYPEAQVTVAKSLALQRLRAIEDQPAQKMGILLGELAFGPAMGAHGLGTPESIATITRDDVTDAWRKFFRNDNMKVAIAGNYASAKVLDQLEKLFTPFVAPAGAIDPPEAAALPLDARETFFEKDCEQSAMGVSLVCLPPADPKHAVETVLNNIMSGGFSARLFSEVREKRGLCYWCSSHYEYRRKNGRFALAAGTTPERAHETMEVMLAELARLAKDLAPEELERARTIVVNKTTLGRERTGRFADHAAWDLFHFGRIRQPDERIDDIRKVTLEDVKEYVAALDLSRRAIVTVGRKVDAQAAKAAAGKSKKSAPAQ